MVNLIFSSECEQFLCFAITFLNTFAYWIEQFAIIKFILPCGCIFAYHIVIT